MQTNFGLNPNWLLKIIDDPFGLVQNLFQISSSKYNRCEFDYNPITMNELFWQEST